MYWKARLRLRKGIIRREARQSGILPIHGIKAAGKPDGQEEAASIDPEKAASYLLNAYYKIDRDLTISAGSFSGLGTLTRPFSGVIVGDIAGYHGIDYIGKRE
ncbi:MAG: hypothetical protein V8S96_02895 [Lachnospiraceae bacterium]